MRKGNLERLAKRLELSNRIIFEGILSLEDVAHRMRPFTCACHCK